MNLTRWPMRAMSIVALMVTMAVGCALNPKLVKCDGRLEPINKPAFQPNAAPVAKVPPPVAAPVPIAGSKDDKATR